MSKKVFVGNLSWNIRDEELFDAFQKYGTLTEAKVITDRHTGRSKGFGFLTFDDSNDALTAISEMNGTDLDGRPLRVGEATEKPRR